MLHLEVMPRPHHGRADSAVELAQNHWESNASFSSQTGTAYKCVTEDLLQMVCGKLMDEGRQPSNTQLVVK